jgi:AAA15 family ATPase/GTPase
MIKDIEINNFRCFDRLKVSGFKRINLISGKNNVGKTALLEAIFLNSTPTKDTILSVIDSRINYSITNKTKKLSEKEWNDLFENQKTSIFFSIDSIFENKKFKKVSVFSVDERSNISELSSALSIVLSEVVGKILDDVLDKKINGDERKEFIRDQKKQIERETLSDNKAKDLMIIRIEGDDDKYPQVIMFDKNTAIVLDRSQFSDNDTKHRSNSSFIQSNKRSSSIGLTLEFDNARLKDRDKEVLNAFQIIDPSIVAVESFSIPEPTIYLKRQGEKRMPLFLFGDAMNRMADIILKIINNQDSVLLIDEIENGIHHSNQVAFWEFMYKLADRLNVQIFATTHSLEMTKAFLQAGLNQPETSAAHFELTRHEKTNKIVAIERDLETLEYAIDRHKEVRGGA